MKGEIKILIAMALAASSSFANAQTVTTQETVTRSVTVTTPNLERSTVALPLAALLVLIRELIIFSLRNSRMDHLPLVLS